MTVPRMHRLLVILFYPGAVVAALGSARVPGDRRTRRLPPCCQPAEHGRFRSRPASSAQARCSSRCSSCGMRTRRPRTPPASHDGRRRALRRARGLRQIDVDGGRRSSARSCSLTSTRLRANALSVVPLAVPFLVLIAIGASQAAPGFVDYVGRRVGQTSDSDINVRFRVEANRMVLDQVREQPVFGVGFGKTTELLLAIPDPTTGVPSLERITARPGSSQRLRVLPCRRGDPRSRVLRVARGGLRIRRRRRYRSNDATRAPA